MFSEAWQRHAVLHSRHMWQTVASLPEPWCPFNFEKITIFTVFGIRRARAKRQQGEVPAGRRELSRVCGKCRDAGDISENWERVKKMFGSSRGVSLKRT